MKPAFSTAGGDESAQFKGSFPHALHWVKSPAATVAENFTPADSQ
jgi:hypothetical protein